MLTRQLAIRIADPMLTLAQSSTTPYENYGAEESPIDDLPLLALFAAIAQTEEDIIFEKNGYKLIKKIGNCLQGQIFKAEVLGSKGKSVAIKKICKSLSKEGIAVDEDDMTLCIAKNIKKEAMILRYLTITNSMIGNYVVQYIDWFETKDHFYLVTEYIDGMTLKEFIKISHEYINNGQLNLNDFQKKIKYIMWQLLVTISFLHDVYHCCHLDLCPENVMLENVKFTKSMDGSVDLPVSHLWIKLCDFGVAEVFDVTKDASFKCHKQDLSVDNMHAPNVMDGGYYDARAADMWSLGMIFYQCMTGQLLYEPEDMWYYEDNGYWALQNNELSKYLKKMNLTQCFEKDNSLSLLNALLNVDEEDRLSISHCVEHEYFKVYLKKYRTKIHRKIKRDRKKLTKQRGRMNNFPYYH